MGKKFIMKIKKKYDVLVWTGFIWLRILFSGRSLVYIEMNVQAS
jgi:hypothetical protein